MFERIQRIKRRLDTTSGQTDNMSIISMPEDKPSVAAEGNLPGDKPHLMTTETNLEAHLTKVLNDSPKRSQTLVTRQIAASLSPNKSRREQTSNVGNLA